MGRSTVDKEPSIRLEIDAPDDGRDALPAEPAQCSSFARLVGSASASLNDRVVYNVRSAVITLLRENKWVYA